MTEAALPTPPDPAADATPLGPTPGDRRYAVVDVLRGFAVFGILTINVGMMSDPIWSQMLPSRWTGATDRAVEVALAFLAQGKFYTLFSLLFGLGLAMQIARTEERGRDVLPLFSRRLGWLAAIGAVHGLLIWYGDILLTYALLGFALLFASQVFRGTRALLVVAIVLLVVPLFLIGGLSVLVELMRLAGPDVSGPMQEQFAQQTAETVKFRDGAIEAYRDGGFATILFWNARQWTQAMLFGLVFAGPGILGTFLLGLWFGRIGVPRRLDALRPAIARALPWLLLVGVAGNALYAWGMETSNPSVPSWTSALAQLGFTAGVVPLALAYAGILILAWDGPARPLLEPLAPVGRMALTNYLAHSVVFALLFNGYGAGLYGSVSPLAGLGMAAGVFALQIPLSRLWLDRFRFGPAEWLWRSLTYRRLQPMRR